MHDHARDAFKHSRICAVFFSRFYVYLSISLSVYLSIHLSTYLSINLFIFLSIQLSIRRRPHIVKDGVGGSSVQVSRRRPHTLKDGVGGSSRLGFRLAMYPRGVVFTFRVLA